MIVALYPNPIDDDIILKNIATEQNFLKQIKT